MAWTEQMVEDLKKMWDEGLTTGEIGKRLNVSKNSIVGKVHRLQLPARPSPMRQGYCEISCVAVSDQEKRQRRRYRRNSGRQNRQSRTRAERKRAQNRCSRTETRGRA